MKATINIALTRDQAIKLAEYLPTSNLYDYDEDPELQQLRVDLMELLYID